MASIVVRVLTEEEAASWAASLSFRMHSRQIASEAAGPGAVVQLIVIDTIAVPLDRWTVPLSPASGAW